MAKDKDFAKSGKTEEGVNIAEQTIEELLRTKKLDTVEQIHGAADELVSKIKDGSLGVHRDEFMGMLMNFQLKNIMNQIEIKAGSDLQEYSLGIIGCYNLMVTSMIMMEGYFNNVISKGGDGAFTAEEAKNMIKLTAMFRALIQEGGPINELINKIQKTLTSFK